MTQTCPFCMPGIDRVFYRDSLVMGLWDGFPVTDGHALLVPNRHVPTWFDATVEEKIALIKAIDVAKQAIESKGSVDGFNIGINSGEAAGQTVFHLHVHVIPRRRGDVADPRGGVRYVIPSKANYLSKTAFINDAPAETQVAITSQPVLTTGGLDPLLPHLKAHLSKARSVDIAVAFTFNSGLNLCWC